ncbi:MAG: quinolinate synthase NadA [Candidatus Marinimicrobia bacterium]|nr:quinolinate synthase NadA [Candidatus Neomarinimicrobiota bacterium]MCH7762432.1 quinolinate synthase NadA [Candidatus Neomarinimicrobiota bacterium]
MSTLTRSEVVHILRNKTGGLLTEEQIQYKTGLVEQILELKESMNALILGHNYMKPGLFYTVPDYCGDSLDLCRKAAQTDKDYIVFCGVRFMAETAKLLNPDKIVLLPSQKAGCSLAAGITAEDVKTLRKQYPGVPVVTYVNTYADVKAESDICCTSSNAAAVVDSLNSDTVIFLPDEYLAINIAKETGRQIVFPTKNGQSGKHKDTDLDVQMIGWKARCEVHEKFTVDDIKQVRKQFPDTYVLAHPECSPEVVAASDYSGSTNQMIKAVEESDAQQYLLLTECAMGDNIAAMHPEKEMLRLCSVRCPHMNEITLEDTLAALQNKQYQIDIPTDIAQRARRAVERMIAIG